MNYFVDRLLNFAIGAVLLTGTLASASAQQAQFHLPFEATWGNLVLPPGDYHLRLPETASGKSPFYLRGPSGPELIVPMTADAHGARFASPNRDYLQLVNVNGAYFVKTFEAGTRALTFFFKTPQPSRKVQISAVDSIKIPVSGE